MLTRCSWVGSSPLLIDYHDTEWGYPQHSDAALFEQLMLVTFQAGLSWQVILMKREHLRRAFYDFDARAIADFGESDFHRLLSDSAIIRNRQKISAAILNARNFLRVQNEFGSFERYVWQFTGYSTLPTGAATAQTYSDESSLMASDMRSRGFRFVGSVTCHAYMLSVGMMDGHDPDCFRRGGTAAA